MSGPRTTPQAGRGHSFSLMRWIKIAVGIADDPKVSQLADAVDVPIEEALGLIVMVLAKLPDHARDGDLSKLSDATIERWVSWRGERSAFAATFRAVFCTPEGVVSAWEKHNGAAIRAADASVERAKKWRQEKAQCQREERLTGVRRTQRATNAQRTPLRDGSTLKSTSPVTGVETPLEGASPPSGQQPLAELPILDDGRRFKPDMSVIPAPKEIRR